MQEINKREENKKEKLQIKTYTTEERKIKRKRNNDGRRKVKTKRRKAKQRVNL